MFLRWVLSSILCARRLLLKTFFGRLQDSTYKYFEVILVDIAHKVVREVRLKSHSMKDTSGRTAAAHVSDAIMLGQHAQPLSQNKPTIFAGPEDQLDCGPSAQAP